MQWLEKLFGGVEMYGLTKKKPLKKIKKTDTPVPIQEEMKFVYDLQMPFQHDFMPITLDEITSDGYHVPLPRPFFKNCYTRSDYDEEHIFFQSILHYTNYMYPLTVDSRVGKKSKSTGESHVSVAQRFAVGRVNYWINTRFVRDLLDMIIIIIICTFCIELSYPAILYIQCRYMIQVLTNCDIQLHVHRYICTCTCTPQYFLMLHAHVHVHVIMYYKIVSVNFFQISTIE